jgi:hypothetical protein
LPLQQQADYPLAIIKEVLDAQSNFWLNFDIQIDTDSQIPKIVLYNAIQKFYNLKRSREEQDILKTEITRLVNFWKKQKKRIENVMDDLKMQEKKVKIFSY